MPDSGLSTNVSLWSLRALALGIALSLLLTASLAHTQEAKPEAPTQTPAGVLVRVVLANGDALTGVVVSRSADVIVLQHAALGEVHINMSDVTRVAPVPKVAWDGPALKSDSTSRSSLAPNPTSGADGESAAQPATNATPASAVARELEGAKAEKWSGAAELGLNGSAGNTERANLRFSFETTRDRPRDALYFSTLYKTSSKDGETIENRLEMRSRQEWKSLGDATRWRVFFEETGEIDQFQDFDFRLALTGGFRYRVVNTKATSLIGRLGLGFSREFGSADDNIKPEALAALEFRHKFNGRLEFVGKGEIYPELQDQGQFRSLLRGSLDIKLTDDKSLALRLGAEHRFDSTPGDAKRSDIDYFLTLVYSF